MAAGGHRRQPGERVSLGAGVGWELRQHLRKRVEPHHGGGPVPARGVAGGRLGHERECVGILPERIRQTPECHSFGTGPPGGARWRLERPPDHARAAARYDSAPGNRNNFIGFRLARASPI